MERRSVKRDPGATPTLAAVHRSTCGRLPSNSLLAHWFTHARSAPAGAVGALVSFPRYLQAIWHLQGMADVPKVAVARIRRLLPRPLAEPRRP